MVYLKNLNSLPEVEKLFSFSQFTLNKNRRDRNVDSIVITNLLLADFISNNTFQKRAVLDWPLIESGVHKFHPLYFKDVEGITSSSTPWYESRFCKDEAHLFVDKEITITNEGEMLIFSGKSLQKVNSETGKLQLWCKENCGIDDWQIRCMTVDNKGVVYVLSGYGSRNTWKYLMTVFSKDGIVQQSTLKFLDNKDARNLFMAATQDERIVVAFVISDQSNITVCGCNKDGELFLKALKAKGNRNPLVGELKSLSISSDNKMAIIIHREERFRRFYKLFIYNMEGNLLKVMKFNPSVKEIKAYDQVIYTPVSKCITGYYFEDVSSKVVIDTFSSVTEKHQSSLMLMNTEYNSGLFNDSVRLVHHVNGKVALVTDERIIHLKMHCAKNTKPATHFDRQECAQRKSSTYGLSQKGTFSAENFAKVMLEIIEYVRKKGGKTDDDVEPDSEKDTNQNRFLILMRGR
ncbi:uncharacterized protein LOC124437916 [Xenia sp. Carnegie-2017]|uniref:uncharacterized protein LOC124437916 n=1 Tax=Xenia sp. Carnegie-2017 TaxID=2897299 RepID=UPI001F04104D|nr:uncharacterized protein LOC124437916 [Xenia sp. Carnegie-2017]